MHTKVIKRIKRSLKELEINNKFRKPYQLLIHPSFFSGKMRSYDVLHKLFGYHKLLITECTYKNMVDSFMTHCEIRNCKRECIFFENKFSKKIINSNNDILETKENNTITDTTINNNKISENIKKEGIHNCIKSILKKRNKFRYIVICSNKEIINELLELPRVPILEVFGMNISLNLSSMNLKN